MTPLFAQTTIGPAPPEQPITGGTFEAGYTDQGYRCQGACSSFGYCCLVYKNPRYP